MVFRLLFSRGKASSARNAPVPAADQPTTNQPTGDQRKPGPDRIFQPLAHVLPSLGGDTASGVPHFRPLLPTRASDPEARLHDVFTPTQPRALGPLFIGRETYLRRLIAAVEEEKAHVVLYGDRGRGKTSLANAFAHLAADAGYIVLRQSCGASTGFADLFRALLADVPTHMIGPAATGWSGPTLLPEGMFGAPQLTEALRRIRNGHLVLLIDEFDRVQSDTLRLHMAETIKNVSDIGAPVTFVILGVAQSLEDLLGQHPSIQRNIVGLYLAPMSREEVRRMVETGAAAARISFIPLVTERLLCFAAGMPYYAHLLCLFAARAAVYRGSSEVGMHDLAVAVNDVLTMQKPVLGRLYEETAANDPVVDDVLYAAAMADADVHKRFVAEALTTVPLDPGGSRHLSLGLARDTLDALVARDGDQGILRVDTPAGPRYAFAPSSLGHYVLFCQAERRGLLETDAALHVD